ncbi:MAG: hypothetical protein R3338_12935, partial [Thermoanaerobaculia bacterium]|nr:hypothetical protein [Thermoanaerobaculia bacterium]
SSWISSMREWFDEGWRVTDRKSRIVEIEVRDDVAFTRRVVEETYSGPDGETSTSRAALAEVWILRGDSWLLSRVDVHPYPSG